MNIILINNEEELGQKTSSLFLEQIAKKHDSVLGFATGSSPLTTYQKLVEDYRINGTDWSQVVTFNLDEYVGLDPFNQQSYHYYMQTNLFDHINIKSENINIPCGQGDPQKNSADYEEKLISSGPIDLQLLGLGTNGHIGFNEPGSDINSITRVVNLKPAIISANQRFFAKNEHVPKQAITMGIKSILQAKKIILIATGTSKGRAIQQLISGKISSQWPCTFLRQHPSVSLIVDRAAYSLVATKSE